MNRLLFSRKGKSVIGVLAFAILMTIFIALSNAASNVTSLEPEVGTSAGNALVHKSDQASSGKYVRFGVPFEHKRNINAIMIPVFMSDQNTNALDQYYTLVKQHLEDDEFSFANWIDFNSQGNVSFKYQLTNPIRTKFSTTDKCVYSANSSGEYDHYAIAKDVWDKAVLAGTNPNDYDIAMFMYYQEGQFECPRANGGPVEFRTRNEYSQQSLIRINLGTIIPKSGINDKYYLNDFRHTTNHEIMHGLGYGLDHANIIRSASFANIYASSSIQPCNYSILFGKQSLSEANCENMEYGNFIDIMGGGSYLNNTLKSGQYFPLNSYYRVASGLSSPKTIKEVTQSGDYVISASSSQDPYDVFGLKIPIQSLTTDIKNYSGPSGIRPSKPYYLVEFSPTNNKWSQKALNNTIYPGDSNYTQNNLSNGVLVHYYKANLDTETAYGGSVSLLDMGISLTGTVANPSLPHKDTALDVGREYNDSFNKVKIKPLEIGPDNKWIKVRVTFY